MVIVFTFGSVWTVNNSCRQDDMLYFVICSVYADVKECFERWTAAGKKICIYSSGSVAAQKLLFSYSESGDLTNVRMLT